MKHYLYLQCSPSYTIEVGQIQRGIWLDFSINSNTQNDQSQRKNHNQQSLSPKAGYIFIGKGWTSPFPLGLYLLIIKELLNIEGN